MDITETVGELLYSGGPNGLDSILVSVHNKTTDPSTGLKHIKNAYEVLIKLSIKSRSAPDDQFDQPLPYRVHFDTYCGTYRRATLFSNQIVYLSLFLIGNMNTLVETCSCPGIFYLNTCERAMSLLNIGLSSLALSLDIGEDEWLMIEVLSVAMSMKAVRNAISEYDLELPKSIEDLQCQLIGLKNNTSVTKNATALPPLTLSEIDEEYNDPDTPPFPSANSDDGESYPQACQLPPVDTCREEKTSDDTIVTSHGSTLDLGIQVKKFLQGLG